MGKKYDEENEADEKEEGYCWGNFCSSPLVKGSVTDKWLRAIKSAREMDNDQAVDLRWALMMVASIRQHSLLQQIFTF